MVKVCCSSFMCHGFTHPEERRRTEKGHFSKYFLIYQGNRSFLIATRILCTTFYISFSELGNVTTPRLFIVMYVFHDCLRPNRIYFLKAGRGFCCQNTQLTDQYPNKNFIIKICTLCVGKSQNSLTRSLTASNTGTSQGVEFYEILSWGNLSIKIKLKQSIQFFSPWSTVSFCPKVLLL